MSSLFKSKAKKSKAPVGLGIGPSNYVEGTGKGKAGTFPLAAGVGSGRPGRGLVASTSSPDVRGVDDFGRARVHAPPAFVERASEDSSSGDHGSAENGPGRRRGDGGTEVQLMYGYTGIFTEMDIGLSDAEVTVKHVAEQIRQRGLECPMLFSTKALDLSVDGTHALIRAFVRNKREWLGDIQIAAPHNLAAFLKWTLARLVDPAGARGILSWQKYKNWRDGEREKEYPARYITTHLLYHLPTQVANLLSSLLELFSSAAAYSSKNGMTVHKIASLFGSFVFGLPDDQSFDYTYNSWLQYSNALEHLILAFIRDQKATSTTGQLPSRLELYIANYPSNIPSGAKPISTARLVTVPRIRRYARFWSKNLIRSAASWRVNRSEIWDRVQPLPGFGATPFASPNLDGTSRPAGKKPREGPTFTKGYKHLLNVRKGFDEGEEEEVDIETQRFRSLVEKEWSGFMSKGFEPPDQKKLEFDLTEGERTRRKLKHQTLDWSSFVGNGFAGRETFLPTDLEFSKNLETTIVSWPEEKKELARKLHKTNKALPRFPYDIEPQEEAPVVVDDNFFEAWADALVASGWARDEMKESNWALVQYKARPVGGMPRLDGSAGPGDGRADEVWILIEEVVPAEYREELEGRVAKKGKKKAAFLRTVKTVGGGGGKGAGKQAKKQKPPPASPASPLRTPTMRHPGDDVFDLRPGETKSMSLTDRRTTTEFSTPTPSYVAVPSTLAASIGRDAPAIDVSPPAPPQPIPVPPASAPLPGKSGSSHGFMADFRAKAKARQAGYRVGPAGANDQAFEYTERPRKERDSLLRNAPDAEMLAVPDEGGDDGRFGRLPHSSSSDTWLDVQVRGNSRTRYTREAYTPSPPGSSEGPYSPAQYARPANPSPPGSDYTGEGRTVEGATSDGHGFGTEEDATARLNPKRMTTGTTTSESPYGGYLDSDLESDDRHQPPPRDASLAPGGRGPPAPLGLRAMAMGSPSRQAAGQGLPKSPRLATAPLPRSPKPGSPDPNSTPVGSPVPRSSPRLDATPVERPPRTSSRPDNTANSAPSPPPKTSPQPSAEAVKAVNPFTSKAAKVSSIVDMFEGGGGAGKGKRAA